VQQVDAPLGEDGEHHSEEEDVQHVEVGAIDDVQRRGRDKTHLDEGIGQPCHPGKNFPKHRPL